jgi:cell growth-regulating nucleolar protein
MVSISPVPVPVLSICFYIACTDVVKKPKLDHHYAQCRNSFTCIDCSETFKSPPEWKTHTSCVTEAEKYQKSLYTGPKKVRRGSPSPSHFAHKRVLQSSGPDKKRKPKTMNAPGKYHQSSGTQSGWSRQQYTRNCASGANSTPLGSPLRMSPVDSSAVESSTTAGAVVVCLSIHQTALA